MKEGDLATSTSPAFEGSAGVADKAVHLLQVNWQALWKPRWQRTMREILVLPLVVLVMLVPLGLFTGGGPSIDCMDA